VSPRTLQLVQNLLITAITLVLAAAVLLAFTRVIEPRDGQALVATTTTTTTPTDTTTTTQPPTTTTEAPTTLPPGQFPWSTGPCSVPPPDDSGDVTALRIFFNCGDLAGPTGDTSVVRVVSSTPQRMTATMRELVKGPTDEEMAVGFGSFWSGATEDAIEFVTIRDGVGVVDFVGIEELVDRLDPIAKQFWLGELYATVFQFETLNAAEFQLGGSCDDFWQLVNGTGCEVIQRADWDTIAASNEAEQ
jgi:hypothetical protein